MLKTITVFLIADKGTLLCLNSTNLQAAITETAGDPDATQWSRAGFSRPDYFGESPVFVGADDTRVLNVQLRERVLPGKVIRTKLLERAAEIAERQGYKCGRKQMAELKEEVVASLLPSSHIKPVDILTMIVGNYLIIGTGSARLVDLVIGTLREALPSHNLNFTPIYADRQVTKWMTDLLLNGSTDSGEITCGTAVSMRGREKETAKFKDVDLQRDEIQAQVVRGMLPVEIAANRCDDSGNERVSFAVTDHLVIKRIRFTDFMIEQAHEEAQESDEMSHFDTNLALFAGEMRGLLDYLMSEMSVEDEL